MALYFDTKVSVESFVDMEAGVTMRHEVDELNDRITLVFGRDEFVLLLGRETLECVVEAGRLALAQLSAAAVSEE
ncbi:hypothetical protein GCM10027271_57650 [Saccharopolyspora gloriosae]|uniref:Uncharacterized protein n=1 Tax=Saccharopolyspora gloriosae TaxID=455344 RepID=A0A840N7A4_9PSEU|nr:hypothetical protein [Saccharopolyspora gloriosae]MBB5067850.1 hypothetical protein [Saccharopolyspora gloriosae]